MKFINSFIFILLIIPFNSLAQSETEPNGSFIQASEIEIDSTIKAFIGESGDEDLFKFDITKGGMIKIELLESPPNIDLHSILYNSNNSQAVINRIFYADEGDGYGFWTSTCEIGDHYLFFEDGGVATNGGDQFNDSIGYKFRIEFIPFDEVDECECDNESKIAACEIELGEVHSALIAPWYKLSISNSTPTVDKDYYKFEITVPSQIHIEVMDVPENIELELFLYDSDDDFVWSDFTQHNGEPHDVWLSNCNVGVYHLYIRDGSATSIGGGTGFNTSKPYSFRIDTVLLSSTDIYECNNNMFNDAKLIELCTPIVASINPWFRFNDLVFNGMVEDVDYFKLELEEGKETDIVIEYVPNEVGICLAIYDKWQEQLESFSGNLGQPLNLSFTPPEDGIYYIEIQDCESNFSINDQYILEVGCSLLSSIEEHELKSDVAVYPNPFSDELNIGFEDYLGKEAKIKIFDIFGQLVHQEKLAITDNLNIHAAHLNQGLYVLQIEFDDKKIIKKVLKK